MAKITIDGEQLEVQDGLTVLQACEIAGKEIPRFCYSDRLSIAGNCRMCLVEIEKTPKLQASCAYPVTDNMVIHTENETVKKARQGVMEFLLINHPLDCPICDQGGECDLQDQAMLYGNCGSKFKENKRAVADKNLGPLIKTSMNRCIHCTRCVRFSTQIAGVPELGATGRGEDMEVGTYVEATISSELSGNMIDLCPVGALTSKPYAFKARSWELQKTESIDILDAVGSNIRIDSKNNQVMRILPRLNEDINEIWISDKTRFSYDGLVNQRIDTPYIKKNNKLEQASWQEAIIAASQKIKSSSAKEIASIAGNLADVESIFILKTLLDKLGFLQYECRTYGENIDISNRANYLFNTSIASIEDADLCLIIGGNPRIDAPMINARIRKRTLKDNFKIAMIGEKQDLTYKVNDLGNDLSILQDIIDNNHSFCEDLKNAKKPIIILSADAICGENGHVINALVLNIIKKYNFIHDDWNGFNLLHKAAGRVGALELGFVPKDKEINLQKILNKAENGKIKTLILYNCDEIPVFNTKNCFIIYIGHHGDKLANLADIILPCATYTEKDAIYVNTEGRPQTTKRAVFPPGEAKEDWLIFTKIANACGIKLEYTDIYVVRADLKKQFPDLVALNKIKKTTFIDAKFDKNDKISNIKLSSMKYNFYMTDPISRASKIMAACTRELENKTYHENIE
jgi:NADH-quinone oxidoreductase subunit G